MPRSARLDIPGLLQHVIVRGNERRPIFLDDQDRSFFLERFSFLLQQTHTDCLAWALLTNHLHLLLRPRSGCLATFMRRLLTSYVVTFNLRHKRSGHLFQNRYKSFACEEESYFLELVRYVHLNPLRAGLVDNLAELAVYPWCGHAVVLGNRVLPGQVYGEVLERFEKNVQKGRAGYTAFIADGLCQRAPDLEENRGLRRWLAKQVGQEENLAADARILGSEAFFQTVQPVATAPLSKKIPLPELRMKVAEIFEVSPELLSRRTRLSGVAGARAAFCYLAVGLMDCNGAEVARMLGMSRAGVSIAVRRGKTILEDKPLLLDSLLN
jgi:REP element-mobilizing transposase RayT